MDARYREKILKLIMSAMFMISVSGLYSWCLDSLDSEIADETIKQINSGVNVLVTGVEIVGAVVCLVCLVLLFTGDIFSTDYRESCVLTYLDSDNKKKKYKLSCNIFPESVNKYISDNIIRKLNEVYLLYKTAKSHKDERLHRYERLYRENISFIDSLISDLENTAKDYKRADEYQREKIKLSIISNNSIVQYIDGIVKEAREIETEFLQGINDKELAMQQLYENYKYDAFGETSEVSKLNNDAVIEDLKNKYDAETDKV